MVPSLPFAHPSHLSKSDRAPKKMADANEVPALGTTDAPFWGAQLPHVVVEVDDVRIVLEDAVKKFSGINDPSNLSKKLTAIMAPYKNGTRSLEPLPRQLNVTIRTQMRQTTRWYQIVPNTIW